MAKMKSIDELGQAARDRMQNDGAKCANCQTRDGTMLFHNDPGFAMGWIHTMPRMWCDVCVLTVQIEHAQKMADELPLLKQRLAEAQGEPEIQVMYGDLTAREHAILQAHDWQLKHPDEASRDAYNVIVGLLGLLPFEELSAALAKEQK